MLIRPVEKADHKEWAELRNQLWPDSIEVHLNELQEFFDGNSVDIVEAFVLDSKHKIVGFIELNIRNFAEGSRSSEVPYIEGWYVVDEYQSQGHGKSLIAMAEKWSKSKGFKELASDTELINKKSISIHKHLGFKETERVVCFLKQL